MLGAVLKNYNYIYYSQYLYILSELLTERMRLWTKLGVDLVDLINQTKHKQANKKNNRPNTRPPKKKKKTKHMHKIKKK